MFDLEKYKQKIKDLVDPNVDYDQDDFNRDFDVKNMVPMEDSFKLKLGFKNESTNPDPEYATSGSSGFDLRANLPISMEIKAGKRAIVPTGLFFEIPDNYEVQIRPRSGLAAKNGVTVLNTPGTIDADYRGEIKVILINLGDEDFIINHGDRIAQGVFASVLSKTYVNLEKLTNISTNTERGSGGFGSTGVQ
jgi:dUTP pyrophosphatase